MKKAIKTFSKTGDLIVDEVEVGSTTSLIPHGNIDLMVVSCLSGDPPVSFFNVKEHSYLLSSHVWLLKDG